MKNFDFFVNEASRLQILSIFALKFKALKTVSDSRKKRAVAIWLLIGVFMIVIQVVLGGITRLTGSGLSITEWAPIMGSIPPMNEQQWKAAFESYQQIAQYKYINNHFTLSDFKFIFYWEWFHRIWARSLGVVFAIPFVYFLIKKYFSKDMILPLIVLFLLGGLQGFIGWFMVSSGLNESSLLYVSHVRLAIHFIAALVLLCYTLWFALKLLVPQQEIIRHKKYKWGFVGLTALLTLQLFYGAFMSGLHAALAAPTWPKMNGRWVPAKIMNYHWINDAIGVQFVHRSLAYILVILIIYGSIKLYKKARENNLTLLKKAAIWPIILVSVQLLLGIFTVISSPKIVKGKFGLYEILAESHQFVAMCLLISLFVILYLIRYKQTEKA